MREPGEGMSKITEIAGRFVNGVLMRSFQAGYDWTSRPHKQELKELEQEIRDSFWTTIVEGDDSTLPEYGDYLVEYLDSGGNKHPAISPYYPNIREWETIPDGCTVTRWMKI